jgi:hypothetical protein
LALSLESLTGRFRERYLTAKGEAALRDPQFPEASLASTFVRGQPLARDLRCLWKKAAAQPEATPPETAAVLRLIIDSLGGPTRALRGLPLKIAMAEFKALIHRDSFDRQQLRAFMRELSLLCSDRGLMGHLYPGRQIVAVPRPLTAFNMRPNGWLQAVFANPTEAHLREAQSHLTGQSLALLFEGCAKRADDVDSAQTLRFIVAEALGPSSSRAVLRRACLQRQLMFHPDKRSNRAGTRADATLNELSQLLNGVKELLDGDVSGALFAV